MKTKFARILQAAGGLATMIVAGSAGFKLG
jgi:hypothetical protein